MVEFGINVDLSELLKDTGKDFTGSGCNIEGGGMFYGGVENGIVYSCCFHPTKEHSATVIPGLLAEPYPRTKTWVPAGQWAVSYTKAGNFGNKAKYDVKD
ncbi:hypothetical protein TVAG_097990 [Trichomonas vaginalis G3]|uniref:Uncharacterized protein n=1 Tax=Trichomonas vaginalis (strain ATCC PRA-98 / G3) TaxID=412133 RepID=A2E2C9_TRIV3|nr:bacteriocin (lactococcin 972) family [Trichomonas vaginalis G3]EAY13229.1 hypothetical protein TVAG_097990 [Trichomonas vaginalis G3]KAI5488139.1 bacteriocin (lactococcin 972) family [Trichomonas vaginalis G3]|eukprot:XP_001325452.1 hypothetical protein [Trichomonas vaginalis G3]